MISAGSSAQPRPTCISAGWRSVCFPRTAACTGMTARACPGCMTTKSVEVLRLFNRLKTHLMPYLLDTAREAHGHGWPMMRAMMVEFPDDPACQTLDLQYMLGAAVLVAPIFSSSGEVIYYLPQGRWKNLLTGESAQGPVWRKEKHGYFSLPMWVNLERGEAWECLKGFQGK